jgi:ADP-ribose pyrophosphatase YjhB (NUDIX family)
MVGCGAPHFLRLGLARRVSFTDWFTGCGVPRAGAGKILPRGCLGRHLIGSAAVIVMGGGTARARVTLVGIAAHLARLRAAVGHELLLVPSVSVLPVDESGQLLLVRHAGDDDGWGTVGGAVELGESPAAAAAREAREEISADVEVVRLVDVLGGPDYEVSYPNGDRTAYVTAVYEARIISGSPAPGDGEVSEFAWFTPDQLSALPLSRFARALLYAIGRL